MPTLDRRALPNTASPTGRAGSPLHAEGLRQSSIVVTQHRAIFELVRLRPTGQESWNARSVVFPDTRQLLCFHALDSGAQSCRLSDSIGPRAERIIGAVPDLLAASL